MVALVPLRRARAEWRVASEALIDHFDGRSEPRDEVHHRTRVTLADRRSVPVLIVNISAHGLMLRSDAAVSVGEWIRVQLPVVGEVHAAVRWALGGRIGCQLDRSIANDRYVKLLGAMTK